MRRPEQVLHQLIITHIPFPSLAAGTALYTVIHPCVCTPRHLSELRPQLRGSTASSTVGKVED